MILEEYNIDNYILKFTPSIQLGYPGECLGMLVKIRMGFDPSKLDENST